ncbi:hypothetical protein [Falsibacillus pallidus]|uniref:Glycosyl transferase family 2 n=1 Tax=Falsibacillus pallidus TaxID=493781 RepID=A0A370GPC9_9BACI|nr:hypothetical protein [Falsibacillus pallidus]RDI45595.1 hypothetical protein DFR59_102224 [Falsibacillus pallidus]
MSNIGLLTVTHDPNGKNINFFKALQEDLEEIYPALFITISDQSSSELIKEMERSKFNVKIIPKLGAAQARREVVNFGLSGDNDYFHYCDFDRLLTWGKTYLDELRTIVAEIPHYDYQILGRTDRAMNTHPEEWIETEKISNKICSLELGKTVDITAGSCSFSRQSAELINEHSKEKMTDAEWAMIVRRIGHLSVEYSAVEGLEYHEEINGVSRQNGTSHEWLARLKLSLIISENAIYSSNSSSQTERRNYVSKI